MADAVPNPDLEAAAAAAGLADPHLLGADPAGAPPAAPPGAPAGADPPDDIMAFIRRMDARMVADDVRAAARAETLAALQRQVQEQAAELALLRGAPDAAVAADQLHSLLLRAPWAPLVPLRRTVVEAASPTTPLLSGRRLQGLRPRTRPPSPSPVASILMTTTLP